MSTTAYVSFRNSELRIIENRRRRNRQLKRHIIMFVASVLILLFISIIFYNKSVASNNNEVLYKYYTNIQVKSGDTLSSLSDTYASKGFDSKEDFINEVVYINNLDSADNIKTGAFIVVPYFDIYH